MGKPRFLYKQKIVRFFFALSIVSIVFLAYAGNPLRAEMVKNLDRLQECAAIVSDSLLKAIPGGEEVCIRVVEHPADWIVDQAFLSMAPLSNVTVSPCLAPYTNQLLMAITDIGINYLELGDDKCRRDVTLAVSASLPHTDGDDKNVKRITKSHHVVLSDTIVSSQTSLLEDIHYDFTIGTLVQQKSSSFWEKVVEPAVVVGTTVVMAILLFTVRSQ